MRRKLNEFLNGTAVEQLMLCAANGDGDDGDGNGESGGGDGDGNGAGNGGSDGGDGSGGDGAKPASGRAGRLGGLFSQRSQGGGDSGDSEGGTDGDGDAGGTEADGRPKGLDAKFWDPDKKAVRFDALIKAQRDAEKALGELKRQKGPGGGEIPETPEGYFAEGVQVPDDADRFAGLTADDPGVKAWADVCKKRGIGKDLARDLMADMLVTMNEHAPVPVDPVQELKSLGKGGAAMVDGLFTWVDGMERAGDLSSDDIDVVEQIMQTAKGARFLAKMRNLTGEEPIPVNPGGTVRGMSYDQLEEAYKAAVKAKDYAEQARLDELRSQINPEGQAPGISGRQGGYNI